MSRDNNEDMLEQFHGQNKSRVEAGKTRKALTGDINELVEMGLLHKDRRGVRACREIIRAFPPVKAEASEECGT